MNDQLSRRGFLETSLFAGAEHAGGRRGSRSPTRRPIRVSCSCCCAARSTGCRPCHRWAIRTTPACAGRSRWRRAAQDAALPLDGTVRAASRARIPASQLRGQGTGGVARGRLAVSRAFAFRRAERARERRPAAAWFDQRLDQPRVDRAAGATSRAKRASRSAPTCRSRCAGRPKWLPGRRRRSRRSTRRRWRASPICMRAIRCCRSGWPRRSRATRSRAKRRPRRMPMPSTDDDGAERKRRRAGRRRKSATTTRATPRRRAPPRDSSSATTVRASRCSTPPAGIPTRTRAVRRDNSALRLRGLDAALAALKESLGPVWRNTVVLVATEFGRTAAINGTRGTDHGTGAAAFLLGGAVAGGRVLADWPGLARANLLEGRDLKPDARSARGHEGRAARSSRRAGSGARLEGVSRQRWRAAARRLDPR